MSYLDSIKGLLTDKKDNPNNSQSAADRFAELAKRRDRRALIEALRQHTAALTRKDVGKWRQAWQYAINVDNPRRSALYDIYRDTDIDLHLSGCVAQRRGFVMSRSFHLVKSDGMEVEEATALFDAPWFKSLLQYALESVYWGHSLIELGDAVNDASGKRIYSSVALLPRKHVIPEYGRVVATEGEGWQSGIEYRAEPYISSLIEVGDPHDLGLYLKAAPQVIAKRNALAYWDNFSEIFGMPLRIAKVNARDQQAVDNAHDMLQRMGHNFSAVFDEGTEIQLVENAKGDAFNVYDRRIDRANSELSKLVIGQTMTIEDGSSLSQSETHLKVFQNLVEADCDMIRDMVNNQLLPRMIADGFPVKGLRFDWDYSIDYTPEQQVAIETMIADRYDIEPEYFAEKYAIPVGNRRQSGSTPILAKGNIVPRDNPSPKFGCAPRTFFD